MKNNLIHIYSPLKGFIIALLLIVGLCLSNKSFAQNYEYAKFTDYRDNKVYNSVTIGEQTWMLQNLAYKCDGSKVYNNNESNAAKYGRLYYFKAAKDACPYGWHLPSDAEWTELEMYLGANEYEYSETIATEVGKSQNIAAKLRDVSVFAVKLTGTWTGKSFADLNTTAYFWTSKSFTRTRYGYSDVVVATGRYLTKDSKGVKRFGIPINYYFSVRCIKDK